MLRTRDLLIRQRTQTINALRGHLTELGEVVPQGVPVTRPRSSLATRPSRSDQVLIVVPA